MKSIKIIMEVLLIMATSQAVFAVSPTLDEMQTAKQWTSSSFDGIQATELPVPSLQIVQSWDSVQKNGRFGRQLQIAGKKV